MSVYTSGRENGRQRPKEYADWHPQAKTRGLREQVNAVLEEYAIHEHFDTDILQGVLEVERAARRAPRAAAGREQHRETTGGSDAQPSSLRSYWWRCSESSPLPQCSRHTHRRRAPTGTSLTCRKL
jgi:hypothetical protein